MAYKYFDGATDDFKKAFEGIGLDIPEDKANAFLEYLGGERSTGLKVSEENLAKALKAKDDEYAAKAKEVADRAVKDKEEADKTEYEAFAAYLSGEGKENIGRLFANVDSTKIVEEIEKAGLGKNLATAKFLGEIGKKFEFNNGVEHTPKETKVKKDVYEKMADDIYKISS